MPPASSSPHPARTRRARSSAAPASGVTARPPVIRAVSVAKYQPPPRISRGVPSAITRPRASSSTRVAKRAANSTSWVATSTAAPAPARLPIHPDRSSLRCRSSPRVGSSRQTSPGGFPPAPRPAIAIASASRWRSPPERSRGSASPVDVERRPRRAPLGRPRRAAPRRPARGRGSRRVAGRAARSRPAPRSIPEAGSQELGGRAQQRALAGAVGAHQGDPLAGRQASGRCRAGPRGWPRRTRARRAACATAAPARRSTGSVGGRIRRRLRQLDPGQSAAGRLDGDRGAFEAGEVEEARRRGRQSRGTRERHPAEALGGAVVDQLAALEREHPVGGGQAALEAVLAERRRSPPTPR